MSNKIIYEGEIDINGLIIPCYVLESGERVLSTAGMQSALGIVEKVGNNRSSGRMDEILTSKAVSRFISSDSDTAKYKPIVCYKGNKKITAYRATMLPEICELMLRVRDWARDNNQELGSRQQSVIIQSDIIIRGLARIGIIALVDEATGYQYEREKDELQKILTAYISKELLPWQKRFPDEFYKEIFRLNGWHYTVSGIGKNNRPGIIGTWTLQLIYNLLPKGVREELERVTPKNNSGVKTAKMHQSLTVDVGNSHLEKQLISVITLMNVSNSWKEFIQLFQRKFAQRMMDEGISPKKYKIAPAELADSTQPDLFTQLKEIGTVPPPKTNSGDDGFDFKVNKALKKGKMPLK